MKQVSLDLAETGIRLTGIQVTTAWVLLQFNFDNFVSKVLISNISGPFQRVTADVKSLMPPDPGEVYKQNRTTVFSFLSRRLNIKKNLRLRLEDSSLHTEYTSLSLSLSVHP